MQGLQGLTNTNNENLRFENPEPSQSMECLSTRFDPNRARELKGQAVQGSRPKAGMAAEQMP